MWRATGRTRGPPGAITAVVSVASLAYTRRYDPSPRRLRLSARYDRVNDRNRFDSLDILLTRLSGHVGRRQYRMVVPLDGVLARLRAEGIDWHDLKALGSSSVAELWNRLQLTPSERVVLNTALDARLCGVLTEAEGSRQPQTMCYRRGRVEHGWRCGHDGHGRDVYFEGKSDALAATVVQRRAIVRRFIENGVSVEVRDAPDFALEGRLRTTPHPRVWAAPADPRFNVLAVGFEMDVHPSDPRAGPYIGAPWAAEAWRQHGEAVALVVWEMLETRAVERPPQPLPLVPGDVPRPGTSVPLSPLAPAASGTSRAARVPSIVFASDDDGDSSTTAETTTVDSSFSDAAAAEEGPRPGDSDDGTTGGGGVAVEYMMRTADGTLRPWFTPADPPVFRHGIPTHLPFAPTLCVRADLEFPRDADGRVSEQRLRAPLLRLSVERHPNACFRMDEESESRFVSHVLDCARRMPFAVPFRLYLRVDPSRVLRADAAFEAERESRMAEKAPNFDLAALFGGAWSESENGRVARKTNESGGKQREQRRHQTQQHDKADTGFRSGDGATDTPIVFDLEDTAGTSSYFVGEGTDPQPDQPFSTGQRGVQQPGDEASPNNRGTQRWNTPRASSRLQAAADAVNPDGWV